MFTSELIFEGLIGTVVIFQAILTLSLWSYLHGRQGKQNHSNGLKSGVMAPHFAGVDARTGEPISTQHLTGRHYLILFLRTECNSCQELAAGLHTIADAWRIVVCCLATGDRCQGHLGIVEHRQIHLIADPDRHIARQFEVSLSPTLIAIDNYDVVVRSVNVQTLSDMRRFLSSVDTARQNLMDSQTPSLIRVIDAIGN